MIPSMFGSKKADRSPVFTEDDIRKLILSFPPPEPRPGKESLVRSLSGRNLIRSDAVIKRFHTLLQSATGPIFLNSLHNELGVHDIQWILAQEDERIYYNRDRRRLLPEGTQKTIYQGIKSELATGGMDLDRVAAEKDITLATLRRILAAQDASLALEDLDNEKTYDSKYLERVKAEILKTIRDTQTAVTLNNIFPQVPITWLESTAKNILSQDGNEAQGIVESVSDGLHFTPQSLFVQHKSELQQAQDAYIQHAVKELAETGYCEVTANSRPQILQKASDADLTQAILKQFAQKDSTSKVLELSTKDSSFLIREKELSEQLSLLAAKAADAASEQWPLRRPGEDVTFDPSKLFDANSSSLNQAILESGDPDNKTRTSFETKIVQLQQDNTESFASTIQIELLATLKLYTQAADSITDPTLQPRVQEFIYDWARKEMTPEVLKTTKDNNLISSKSASRDMDKFSDAIQAARTLDDLLTATAKLARKQKIEQPSPSLLQQRKQEILTQKVAGMKRMKRASDLLQNVIWILLAKQREGLYMSSGKDTSRMIKMVKEGDKEAGGKLEEWRDLVKQGKDTDATRKEMRDVAAKAVEELKAGPEVASSEVETTDTADEVKEEESTT
ncbi:hypothetical protein D6C78_03805 [Aureobasidium pullulans]|uniref:Uncharacterized protein n=1 Tax=Aureobasidium pullulans TaxID=5580 RepID=A0A4T0BV42_AURPU|nr:hypothetical protein D6C78_03805 [Aureobasidium pullulans]